VIGTLRRYDQGGQWLGSDVGWSKSHTDWTEYPWLKTGNFGATGVAVDAEQNIILVGIAFQDGQPRSYIARFDPNGVFQWEIAGLVGTEARGVGVQPDGTIYVAGAKRTGVDPERWDMEISVFGADKTAYGPIAYSDPDDIKNLRSERGRAVIVLKSGRVVIVGTREIVDPNDTTEGDHARRGAAVRGQGQARRRGVDIVRRQAVVRRDHGGSGHRRGLRHLRLRLLGPKNAGEQEPDPHPLARRGSPGDQGPAPGDHAGRRHVQRARLQHGGRDDRRRARQRGSARTTTSGSSPCATRPICGSTT
jgi:hypothetical protein